MKNPSGVIVMVCLLIAVTLFIRHISDGIFGPKLCKEANCPNEAISGKYCSLHECINISCNNKRADGFSYCVKCLKKAGYDLN